SGGDLLPKGDRLSNEACWATLQGLYYGVLNGAVVVANIANSNGHVPGPPPGYNLGPGAYSDNSLVDQSFLTAYDIGSIATVFGAFAIARPSPRAAPNGAARLPQDVAVNPVPPRALSLNRSVGRASHNQALQSDIANLPRGATDIRVNQQQVNALGQRVGINRPDLQYTLNGRRHCVEYEGLANPRGLAHETRILANDPNASFTLRLVP
ncbi:MAG: hypothetical protein AAF219_11565, partial [Myxococcota bacterium]